MERSDTVLWTLAPPGIVLHNFARRCFLELDGTGYKAWGFLDGARSVDEVVSRSSAGQDGGKPLAEQEDYVRQIVETLVENGFVVDRPTGEPAR